jgi:DNA-3-methyladenine glycosylase
MNPGVETNPWAGRDTVAIARGMLGATLVRRMPDGAEKRLRITETEAYHGPEDRACHASKGRTARTDVMFGPAGVWYVYLCYGVHEMLNLVTGPRDWPAAVLIRGVEGLSGPGRVTRALEIDRALNGAEATANGGLRIEPAEPGLVQDREIVAGPRVGVDYAGPEWAAKPWRFRWMARWTPARVSRTRTRTREASSPRDRR